MAANQAQMAQLVQLLTQTVSGNTDSMKAAEQQLRRAEVQPGFGLILLELLRDSTVAVGSRQAGAIYFKNYIRRQWSVDVAAGGIPPEARQAIKQHIFGLMLQAPKQVQVMLAAGIEEISVTDYPGEWQSLLPEIVSHLKSSQDITVLKGAMDTAHTVFMKFRSQSRCNDVLREILYTVKGFQDVHLAVFKAACQRILSGGLSNDQLVAHFDLMQSTVGTFFSLNVMDIPEFFEEHKNEYFKGFVELLKFQHDAVTGKADLPGPLEQVQASICECFKLYASMYQEQFESLLLECVQTTWELLVRCESQEKHDQLVARGIGFLSSAASFGWQQSPFKDHNVLTGICEKVVFANILLRDTDVELFEENPLEYVRRDMEGADQDTRRRSAQDLVKALGRVSEEKVTEILLAYVKMLMAQVQQASPEQAEKAKDACIHLCIAMAVRGQTMKDGVTVVNPHVSIDLFFNSLVVPELNSAAPVTAKSVLRASCLKFVTTFRNQLTRDQVISVLPAICRHIAVDCPVVHTYAGICLEKIIMVRDRHPNMAEPTGNRIVLRFDAATMRPSLLQVVDPIIERISRTDERQGIPMNEYLMRTVARIFAFLKQQGAQAGIETLGRLARILHVASANPSNPVFNHNLFEAVASIVRVCVPVQPDAVEGALLPVLGHILQNGVVDFLPYSFQMLGLLLDASPAVKPLYQELFAQLLTEETWRSQANVPGLVRLLRSYFRKHAAFPELLRNNMQAILQRFQFILQNRKTEDSAFDMLNAMYAHLPTEFYQQHLKILLTVLLQRLHTSKSLKFKRLFVVSCSLLVHKDASGNLFVQAVSDIQAGLLTNLVANVWTEVFKTLLRPDERKVCTVGLIKLMATQELKGNPVVLAACCGSLVSLLGLTPSAGLAFSPDGEEEEEPAPVDGGAGKEYEASFSKLQNTELPGTQGGIAPDIQNLHSAAQVMLKPFAGMIQQMAQATPELMLLANMLR